MSADLSAEWRSHILAVRGPALVAIGVQVAQLLLRPIPSEVSPLDQAISGNTHQPRRELSVLLAAAPAVLAFGLPLAAMVLLRLPLRLSRSPPLRSRGLALGVLLVASLLSVAAVQALRGCFGEANSAPCTRAPFLVCRHPISLSIVLLAAALTWLLPSLPGLVGSVWLAFHFDGQLSAEEVVLRARFGAGWLAYAAEVPRWPGAYAGGCLLLACACCGWICERALRARDARTRAFELEEAGWFSPSTETPAAAAPAAEAGEAGEAEGTQGEARLPVGLVLVVLAASQAQRVAFLPEQRTLFVCGVPQDLKAALSLACVCLLTRRRAPRRLLSRLLCAVALLVLGIDLFLRLNAGVRLNLDLTAYGLTTFLHSASAGAPSLLLANLAMAPPGTLRSAAAMVPLAVLLVRASDVRVRSTRPWMAAVVLAVAVAFVVESPCCGAAQGISVGPCSAAPPGRCCEAKVRAQSANVLNILAGDVWERASGGDAAASQGRLLALHAIEFERREVEAEAKAAAEARKGKGSVTPCAAAAAAPRQGKSGWRDRWKARRPRRGGHDGATTPACAQPTPPRSRNVVLITVESLGALYTDLYNSDAHSMPFLSGLFNAAKPGDAFLLERLYASEPNTLHALFASLCGMRPHLGMSKLEYLHKQRLAQCLPARLRAEAIHSGFYTTSNVGLQSKLGFSEVWSSMEDYPNSSMMGGKEPSGARKRTKSRLRWPKNWWTRSTAALLKGRSAGQYNWLGDHDFFGLPKARDFIAARGKRRFFLHMMTVSSHHPYVGICPTHTGGANGLAWKKGSVTLARKPYNSTRQRGMLRAYLRELRCVDEYIRQVHGILKRAGRLHDTSLVIVGDHGEGFELAHEHDRVHGGTVYETQVRLPFVAFGPIARGMPKRVPGLWSDTAIAPTLLEALGLRHRDCRSGAGPGSLDFFGCSVLSSPPPQHAMVSCAFDGSCVGLVMQMDRYSSSGALGGTRQLWKFASFGENRMEAYLLDADKYEDIDRSGELPAIERTRALYRMRAWLRAMQDFWKG